MTIENDPYLRAAREAVQSGQTENAVKILTALLSRDKGNVEAWFLLSAAVDDLRASVACLRNTLALDPNHAGAIQAMRQLEQQSDLGPLTVMRVGRNSAAFGQSCPFCAGQFNLLDQVVACPQCGVSHHWECWKESGHACTAAPCNGFSLYEIHQSPLPEQPPQRQVPVIVIQKEDIPETGKASREEQERKFQRRLLMLALMKEEGMAPVSGPLPSADEILELLQQERSGGSATGSTADIKVARLPQTRALPQFCPYCGQKYPRPQSRYCMACGRPRATHGSR